MTNFEQSHHLFCRSDPSPENREILSQVSDHSVTGQLSDHLSIPDKRRNFATSEWGLVAALMAHPKPEILANIKETLLDESPEIESSRLILQAIMENHRQLAAVIPKSMNEQHAFVLSKQILVQYFKEKIANPAGYGASPSSVKHFQAALRSLDDRNLVGAIRHAPAPWQERIRDINRTVTNEIIESLKKTLVDVATATKSTLPAKISDLTAARIALEQRIATLEKVEDILDPPNGTLKNPVVGRISRLLDQFNEFQRSGAKNGSNSLVVLRALTVEARKIELACRKENDQLRTYRTQLRKPSDKPLRVREEYVHQIGNPGQARLAFAHSINEYSQQYATRDSDPLTDTLRFILAADARHRNIILPVGRRVELHDLIAMWRPNIWKYASIHDVVASLEIGQRGPDITAIVVMQDQANYKKLLAVLKRGMEIIFVDVIAGQIDPPIIQKLFDLEHNDGEQQPAQYFLFRTDSNPDLKRLAY